MLLNKTVLVIVAGLLAGANSSPAVLEARATNTALQTVFPASTGSTALAAAKTIAAGASFDGSMKKWDRSGEFPVGSETCSSPLSVTDNCIVEQ